MFHTSTRSLPPNHFSTSLAGLRLRSARLQLPSCAFHGTILTWRRCVPFATAWLNSCSKWNQLLYTLQSWKNSEITIDHCLILPILNWYMAVVVSCNYLPTGNVANSCTRWSRFSSCLKTARHGKTRKGRKAVKDPPVPLKCAKGVHKLLCCAVESGNILVCKIDQNRWICLAPLSPSPKIKIHSISLYYIYIY